MHIRELLCLVLIVRNFPQFQDKNLGQVIFDENGEPIMDCDEATDKVLFLLTIQYAEFFSIH